MLATGASAALVCGGALALGHAILLAAGLGWSRLAAPVGLSGLLAIATLAVRLPGHAVTAALVLAACTLLALAVIARASRAGRPSGSGNELAIGLITALAAALVAALPFAAAGHVGILGVGLVNDDMASHLVMADWLQERSAPEPALVADGYPLGPHSLVAALASLPGVDLIAAFAGLVVAIPALTALTALHALPPMPAASRVVVATLTALPYLTAAYLAQEAFKEPIEALLVIGFALVLPLTGTQPQRAGLALGVIAAGAVYVYSFPGVAWLVGTAVIWCAVRAARGPAAALGPRLLRCVRAGLPVLGAAGLVAVVLLAPEAPRLLDFSDFRAFDPGSQTDDGLGNLGGQLSPLEAFGIWPTSEFRLAPGAGSLPAWVFWAGSALAVLAFVVGLRRWVRLRGVGIPAALLTAGLLYLAARGFGTVYTSAKALAIAAPPLVLIALGGLLMRSEGDRTRRFPPIVLLAAAFALAAALSSFLVLRQAPVGPREHMDELAEIRPLVTGEKVLFLGRDNFVLYELRGSKPFTHVRNYYDPYFVKPNFELREVGSKFDFDSVDAEKLGRFPFVLTTRASYASGPPPGYEAVHATPSYVLWARGGQVEGRQPVETGPEPTAELDCEDTRRTALGPAAFAAAAPVRARAEGWSEATIEDGSPATLRLELPDGLWSLSLRYDSTQPVRLTGQGGLDAELPGNLDYRGVAPFWPAGEIESEGDPIEITAAVEGPSAAGRLLGANSVAHLGDVAATLAGPRYPGGPEGPHPGLGERIVPAARILCGEQVDWIEPVSGPRD